MAHLLVTNDFPPKVGGIQTYLWELWRRLPPEGTTVLTTRHEGSAAFDRAQPFRVERVGDRVLLPRPSLLARIRRLASEVEASVVVLDPALPLGLLGPRLDRPYALVLHGSELLGRLPLGSKLMGDVVSNASHVICAGNYPASEARRVAGSKTPPLTVIPPGVDTDRFRPLTPEERKAARREFGLPENARLVVGVSRLVPRKGFDRLIEAAGAVASSKPDVFLAIGGGGRDRDRLQRLIDRTGAPAVLLGRVADDRLPLLYGCADAFAMLCRTRWAGLEPEGFGIVFLEAAACGVPQLAGDSGGAADAVVDGETGIVVRDPRNTGDAAAALARLLDDTGEAQRIGNAARHRAVREFTYDHLARRLHETLTALEVSP